MILGPMKKKGERGSDPRERSLWADLMAVGMVFPIAIVAGLFAGRWIGGWFGHKELGQWIGLAWGIAAAFWDLFKTSRKLDRFDAAGSQRDPSAEDAKPEALPGHGDDEDDDQS